MRGEGDADVIRIKYELVWFSDLLLYSKWTKFFLCDELFLNFSCCVNKL